MHRREDNTRLVFAVVGLALAILVAFQVYQWREPARLHADAAADRSEAVEAGERLYLQQCAACHGPSGKGLVGPALNSKGLLSSVTDRQFFELIRSGVPGTAMPAWAQEFGGPLTDEQVRQIVAFVRAWEETAPVLEEAAGRADPANGLAIFEATCIHCHGPAGSGTERAPALNDQAFLKTYDNDWLRTTIRDGRPSKGMPTWGTVLSPAQIDDLVALLAAWRQGEPVSAK